MKNRGFDFGDFEITKREILASISIIAMMLLIGFVISGRISNYILDRNEKYNKAIKIESSELFEYGMRTNVGYAFVYGNLKAVDTVSYPEINGEYMYIEKIEEHYNMHTRTVTTTDSKGKTHTKTETYWSWDYAGSEEQRCYGKNDKEIWWQMIQLLPSSYNQTRNVMMNYEVLANIYKSRKDHKLDEWRSFCKWIEELPYSDLITGGKR